MSNIYDAQLARMKDLMSYGVNESTAREGLSTIERMAEGADGKTYGIIREGKKFYIKSAPKKESELIAEDFDYIGGFMNKKNYEYLTYPIASKQFELKLMSVNEACNANRPVIAQGVNVKPADWQINETKEMRAELNRYAEIVNNVSHILKEDKDGGFTMNHTLPEAPAKNPSDDKVNAPFTDTAVAKLDKDLKETETNPEKAGGPYTEDGKVTDKDMQSDKTPGNGADDGTYCEKPEYVDTGVAGQHPKGGKVVRVSEAKTGKTVRLTMEQVLAWNKSKDFMDKTNGTEIGSSAPYTDQVDNKESNQGESGAEHIHEDAPVVHNTDNQNSPTPGTNEKGDSAPYTDKVDNTVNEEVVDVNTVAGMGDSSDVPFPEVEKGGYEKFEEDYNDWLNAQEPQPIDLGDEGDNVSGDFQDDLDPALVNIGDAPYEGKNRNQKPQVKEGTELNDFGKHVAFQKTPMTIPPNKEVTAGTGDKDWNDDSAKGEKPFATKIGSSAPYTEEVIDMLTDAIMKRINLNKKKV